MEGLGWGAIFAWPEYRPPLPLPPRSIGIIMMERILCKIRFSKSLDIKIREAKDLGRDEFLWNELSRHRSSSLN
jgi:hypothetical protein